MFVAGNQYLPSVAYFAHWLAHGKLYLEAHEHYQKRSWRNRTWVQGKDTPIILSVPLQRGKNERCSIQEVRIAYDEPWPHLHLQSIQSVYGKSAFFEEVFPEIELTLRAEFETLWELNLKLNHTLTSMLHGRWPLDFTKEFIRNYGPENVDARTGIPCGIQPGAHTDQMPSYLQIQRIGLPFQPNLSILDVLCHLGPETIVYLHHYRQFLYPSV